jgi:hypothetical protein
VLTEFIRQTTGKFMPVFICFIFGKFLFGGEMLLRSPKKFFRTAIYLDWFASAKTCSFPCPA